MRKSRLPAAVLTCLLGYGIAAAQAQTTLTLNVNSFTGRTVPASVWGFATGALADNKFANAANTTVQASAAKLLPTVIRVNADQNICQLVFAAGVGSPDYSYFNNWFANYTKFAATNVVFIVGIGPTGSDTSITPSTWGTYASTLAAHFQSVGTPIRYWEVGNENDAMGASTYATYFTAIANALHGVDATYQVGGPVTSWYNGFSTGGGGSLTTFATAVGTALNFVDFHSYLTQSGAASFAAALGYTDTSSARAMLAGTPAANVPIGLLEYNENGTPPGDITQSQVYGAVYESLLLTTSINQDSNFQFGGLWDLVNNSYYGAIGNNGTAFTNIDPQGWFLGFAGQNLFGSQINTTVTHSNETVLATLHNISAVAACITNYSTTTAQTENIVVNGGGTPVNISRWELSAANPNTISGSISSLSGISVPAESIVCLTLNINPSHC